MTPRPIAMTAELTHRCPLRCVYCSNPLLLVSRGDELDGRTWQRVIGEAAELGVLQLHLSGGEPLVRNDLEAIVRAGAERELYTNLITSGFGLDAGRARRLAAAGLKGVQISLQDAEPSSADEIAGCRADARKVAASEAVLAAGLALSINVVLHRRNIDRIDRIVDRCLALGAERLELANTQFYGWALLNRAALLPTRDQVVAAEAAVRRRRASLRRGVELAWVLPDYYEPFPKPCMGGWGSSFLTVAPDGAVLPCPAARSITSLTFDNVRDGGLEGIWETSAAFSAYRGLDWLPEPCRSCDRRTRDHGGCRCQAFALTGDASRTDPVCRYAPDHHLVEAAVAAASSPPPGRSEALVHRGRTGNRDRR